MRNMQLIIYLYNKGRRLGAANSIFIVRKSESLLNISLKGLKILKAEQILKGKELTIQIIYKKQVYADFVILPLSNITLKDNSEIKIQCSSDIQFYDQNLIDIFHSWDRNQEISWNSLNENQQKAWLTACLYWSGIPNSKPISNIITLNGAIINNEASLYYLLGELFFGDRGYLGQDLDGLDDCLINIHQHISNTIVIRIENFSILRETLNRYFENYTDQLISVFKRHGVNIQII